MVLTVQNRSMHTMIRTDDMVEDDVLEEFIEESISGRVLALPSFSSPRLGRGQCSRIVCRRSIVKTCEIVRRVNNSEHSVEMD